MMEMSTYLDENTSDNRRADITVTFTVNESNPSRRKMHYENRHSYEKFLHHDDYRNECRDVVVDVYNCLIGQVNAEDNGIKIFTSSDFPQDFHSNPIHDWLKFEFEIEDHFPKIGMVAITGADDKKYMELACHFVDIKPEARFRG